MNVKVLNLKSPSKWTDSDIKKAAERDKQFAMEIVIKKYRDSLYYHALCILKDSDLTYDLIQEVFIRAIREERFFTAEFYMKPWLYRVTTNLCFNQVRNRNRREALLDQNRISEAQEAKQCDDLFEKERRSEVLNCIQQLNADHQEVLLLRYYSDLSYNEIAQTLNIKLGTVMSRLSRARSSLSQILGPDTELLTK